MPLIQGFIMVENTYDIQLQAPEERHYGLYSYPDLDIVRKFGEKDVILDTF